MSSVSSLVLLLAALGGAPRGEVLDFSATWCGPCQQMSPIVSRLEREGLPIRKVDVERERKLAEQLRVRSIPTFVLLIDGKEAHRIVGMTSEADLRRLIAQIPAEPAAAPPFVTATETPATSSGAAVSVPGDREALPREPLEELAGTVATEQNSAADRRGLLDFLRPREPEPQPLVARGNEPEAAAPVAAEGPMAASARLHVTIAGHISVGSGTIVDSRPGRTLIVTCGHIFRGMNQSSKVDVDLFDGAAHRKYVGTVVRYDEKADVGLVAVPTDAAVPSVEILPPTLAPQMGDRVACIGCSGGAEPTREQLSITAINKYTGPDNIECTGVPVQGRSGGGLFDADGRLIGVCIAADQEAQRGLYAHAYAIHELLDQCNLAHLYQPRTVADPDLALAYNEPDIEEAPPAEPAPVTPEPDDNAFERAVAGASSAGVNDIAAGEAEVVVIIRPRNQPNAPSRIVIINQASPKFFAYLNGEMEQPTEPMTAHRMPAAGLVETARQTADDPHPPRRHESRRAGNAPAAAAPAALAPPTRRHATKAALQPTALSQPAPRAYVRSAASR
jgi:thiol-disulfide isomerase/thioredoxin